MSTSGAKSFETEALLSNYFPSKEVVKKNLEGYLSEYPADVVSLMTGMIDLFSSQMSKEHHQKIKSNNFLLIEKYGIYLQLKHSHKTSFMITEEVIKEIKRPSIDATVVVFDVKKAEAAKNCVVLERAFQVGTECLLHQHCQIHYRNDVPVPLEENDERMVQSFAYRVD